MDNEGLKKLIIEESKKNRNINDIIPMVCENGGMEWKEAQNFIRRVQLDNKEEISKSNNILFMGLGILTTLAGAALFLMMLWETLDGTIIFFLSFPVPYLGNIFYMGFGILLAAGGVMGILKTRG